MSLPVELGSLVAIWTSGSVSGWFRVSYVYNLELQSYLKAVVLHTLIQRGEH